LKIWPKGKVQKGKQRSTEHTHKTKDRVTRTPPGLNSGAPEGYAVKKKRLKPLRPLRDKSIDGNQKERLIVATTWQLNIVYIRIQSEDEGLGSAAITVMEVVSFLFADDIPVDIINVGMPQIDDDDFIDAF